MAHSKRFRENKCPLEITKIKFNIWTYFFSKIWKITMAPMGKIRQCFKPSKLRLCI